MAEKVLSTVQLSMGNGPQGRFEYEIHQVTNNGVNQYRLRLWDCKDKRHVRFAKTVNALLAESEKLIKESVI